VQFSFDSEQQEFAAALRRALADRAPLTRWLTPGAADGSWRLINEQLQAGAPDVPEHAGGLGLSAVELAIAAEESGRVVAPVALVAGMGITHSLLLAAGEPAAGLLEEAVSGRQLVLGADPAGAWIELHLEAPSTVSGSFYAPIGAREADAVLALVTTPDGGRDLVTVDLESSAVEPLEGIDPTAGSARVTLQAAPVTFHAPDIDDSVLAAARRRARLVIAAQALGGARSCLEMTTTFAGQRVQFGQPIGSFQAVKHRLADLFVETELAATAVYLAACELTGPSAESATASAYDVASSVYQRAARDCIQLHGGMGFTWEHPAHLHLERAQLLASLLGPSSPAERYASALGGVA